MFNYTSDVYILLDIGGFELVPTELTDNLVGPVIPAGETITGELTYATTNATETFNMVVTGYPQFVVDTDVVQVTGEG